MAPKLYDAPHNYSAQVYLEGLDDKRQPLPFDPFAWEPLAKERLSADSFGYVWGSAGSRETDESNRAAFKKWAIMPSRLVKTHEFPNMGTRVFGQDYKYPIAMAPVGVQRIFHRDGELASAAAARVEDVPYIMSSATSYSIEEIAEANGDGPRWFQLYWPSNEDNDITASILARAQAANYTVLVVTLDTFTIGWRPSDMQNAFNPFLRPDSIGVDLGFSDPVFRKRFADKHGKSVEQDLRTAAAEWTRKMFPQFTHSWEDLKFLRQHWRGPIVLKGIQTVADAKLSVEHGMDGIVVSNHGGRQQDGGVGSLEVLPMIVDAVGDRIDIAFDSGVRCAADAAKALALGAKMVFVGRPYIYGLAIGGSDGVRHVLRAILGDLQTLLHLAGIPSASQKHLNRSVLWERR